MFLVKLLVYLQALPTRGCSIAKLQKKTFALQTVSTLFENFSYFELSVIRIVQYCVVTFPVTEWNGDLIQNQSFVVLCIEIFLTRIPAFHSSLIFHFDSKASSKRY